MADNRTFIHRIDADDLIEHVNEEWLEFAAENWDRREAERIVGMPLWEYVANSASRHVWITIVERLRGRRTTVTVPYRCDSPSVRRYMEMDLVPLAGDRVEFRSRIVREEEREPVPLLRPDVPTSDEPLLMCSWCKRVFVPPWREVEKAAKELDLFDEPEMPKLVHSICGRCRDTLTGSV